MNLNPVKYRHLAALVSPFTVRAARTLNSEFICSTFDAQVLRSASWQIQCLWFSFLRVLGRLVLFSVTAFNGRHVVTPLSGSQQIFEVPQWWNPLFLQAWTFCQESVTCSIDQPSDWLMLSQTFWISGLVADMDESSTGSNHHFQWISVTALICWFVCAAGLSVLLMLLRVFAVNVDQSAPSFSQGLFLVELFTRTNFHYSVDLFMFAPWLGAHSMQIKLIFPNGSEWRSQIAGIWFFMLLFARLASSFSGGN